MLALHMADLRFIPSTLNGSPSPLGVTPGTEPVVILRTQINKTVGMTISLQVAQS